MLLLFFRFRDGNNGFFIRLQILKSSSVGIINYYDNASGLAADAVDVVAVI